MGVRLYCMLAGRDHTSTSTYTHTRTHGPMGAGKPFPGSPGRGGGTGPVPPRWGRAAMAAGRARTVLLTGCNRGIGLELVKQLLATPRPPAWIFATCRDPEGPRAQVRAGRDRGGQVPLVTRSSNFTNVKKGIVVARDGVFAAV